MPAYTETVNPRGRARRGLLGRSDRGVVAGDEAVVCVPGADACVRTGVEACVPAGSDACFRAGPAPLPPHPATATIASAAGNHRARGARASPAFGVGAAI